MNVNASLGGQHALVTGASRGIGAAIAAALAERGAKVTLLGRNQPLLDEVARSIGERDRVVTQRADVTNSAELATAVARAREQLGLVTILINNAGQARSAPFHGTDDGLWDEMLNVNLTGTYRCIKAVLQDMLEAGSGRIVNIASTAGLTGYPYVTAYCAAKHGVIGLTRALAIELARKNITVNAVCPGYTETDVVRQTIAGIQAKTGRSEADAKAALIARNPQGRFVQPEEVAATVAWLCMPGMESITGQSIAVAGGEVM